MADIKLPLSIQPKARPVLKLEGLDLAGLSLEGLENTEITDARNLPEMGASSATASCSCCVDISPDGG